MKEVIKISVILTGVCVICGILLALVYGLSKERIAINAQKRITAAIETLAPQATEVMPVTAAANSAYKLFDRQSEFIGYALIAAGQGYQGNIKMIAIVDADLSRLQGIEIIESSETPGLGAKIQDTFFKEQFRNLNVAPKISYTKEAITTDNQIKAITGATVSSRAVVNILNQRLAQLKHQEQGAN